jgi:hypothetical protein
MTGTGDDEPKLSDADVEALLARPQPSHSRRERVLGNVLAAVAKQQPASVEQPARGARPTAARPWWRRWPAVTALTGAAAAGVLAVVVGARPADDGWRSRGGSSDGNGGSPSIEVGCSLGGLDRCPANSTLIFRVHETTGGYLFAYADRAAGGRQPIWYFTGLALPGAAPGTGPVALRQGVRLGPEHTPGTYDVHLVVTRTRLAAGDLATAPRAEVVSRQTVRLVVVP